MKIGLYPMVADILHIGHIIAIEEAKKNCDYLIVALHCCPEYKNPIQSVYERFMQLRAIKWIDEIIPYANIEDIRNMALSLNYDIYFLGDDHKNSNWDCSDILNNLNKEIFYLSRNHNYSSTYFKNKIFEHFKIDR